MIAGPNGSGKTTLVNHLRSLGVDFGRYINPDDLAMAYDQSISLTERSRRAQAEADRLRQACVAQRLDFSFETVMSHASKLEFFTECRRSGYYTLLIFVSTTDPELNVARVAQRVALGGHHVPPDRIVARYARTMSLLPAAVDIADRAVIYDNSTADGLKLGLSKRLDRGVAFYQMAPDAPDWIRDLVPKA